MIDSHIVVLTAAPEGLSTDRNSYMTIVLKPAQVNHDDECRPTDKPRTMIVLQPRRITHILTKYCGQKGRRTSHDSCCKVYATTFVYMNVDRDPRAPTSAIGP